MNFNTFVKECSILDDRMPFHAFVKRMEKPPETKAGWLDAWYDYLAQEDAHDQRQTQESVRLAGVN